MLINYELKIPFFLRIRKGDEIFPFFPFKNNSWRTHIYRFIAPRDFLTDLLKVFDILSLYNDTREWKKALVTHVPLKKGFKLCSDE